MTDFLEKKIKSLQVEPKGDNKLIVNLLRPVGFQILNIYDFINFNLNIEGSQEILLSLLENDKLTELNIISGVLYTLGKNKNQEYHKRILQAYLQTARNKKFPELKYECYCLFKKKIKKSDSEFKSQLIKLINIEIKNNEYLKTLRLIEGARKINDIELKNKLTDLEKTLTTIR